MTDEIKLSDEQVAQYQAWLLESANDAIADHEDDCRDEPDERHDLDDPECSVNAVMLQKFVMHQQSEISRLRALLKEAGEVLAPFVALLDTVEAKYRKRGGDPDIFVDDSPSFDIRAKEITKGQWRAARALSSRKGETK